MVRAVQTLPMTLPSVGITIRRECPDRGPKESSSRKDFYLGGILSKLRHFAGHDIILLVGNGIELFIVLMHELTQQGT